jgi:hypothetical protein
LPPSPSPSPGPSPRPSPTTDKCIPNVRGPPCKLDASGKDPCLALSGCVRCSHHGFCTDQPLMPSQIIV